MSRQLAEMLLKEKLITNLQFQEAESVGKSGKSYIRYLIEKGYVEESKVLVYLSKKFSLPTINLSKFEIQPEVLKLVPLEVAKKSKIIPIQANTTTLVVVLCDPIGISNLESVKYLTKLNVEVVLTTFSGFDTAFQKYYTGGASLADAAIESYKKENKLNQSDNEIAIELVQVHEIDTESSSEQDVPVIQIVNGILAEAIKKMASDIHVEPYENKFRIRMRIDGVLYEILQIPFEMKRAVIARFKIMSRMDIAETRIPQDGRIKLKFNGKDVDFRVNSIPTLFGEKIVLRMLSKGNLQLDFLKLGFEKRQLELFKKGIYSPNGLVLVTGPTGSGKTTTLYSAISELNQITDNVSTVEDPVEYNLEGVNQVQVHKEIGLTFASVLRALLRQDPDTVLVGEIRDYETAEVAIQAALTGHLVLSTLHTNDAPSTITRLMNMGLEPFLVVAAVNTVIAQRLLRTICSFCKVEESVPKEKWIEFGYSSAEAEKLKAYRGSGCPKCNQTGYKGRVAIYEVMEFSPHLKELVLKGETMLEFKKAAIQEGMQTLRISSLAKVIEGKTTLEDAISSTLDN